MITITKDKINLTNENNSIQTIFGLSTDTKPTDEIINGSIFIEMDTSKIYFYDLENEQWREFNKSE